MVQTEFNAIIDKGTWEEKFEAIQKAKPHFLQEKVFNTLITGLHEKNHSVCFFSLYYLIDKFSSELPNVGEKIIALMISFLEDKDSTIVDRTA